MCMAKVHAEPAFQHQVRREMVPSGGQTDCLWSLLVGDPPFPGCKHVVKGVPADAGPKGDSQRGKKN